MDEYMDGYVADIPGHVVWHDVEAKLVLFNAQDGTYHALDETASEAWKAVARLGRVQAVIEALGFRYPMDRTALADDVRAFVSQAVQLGLLTLNRDGHA